MLKADITHLHTECKQLPIQEHLTMLCKQFLVSALPPTRLSHTLVTCDPGPRANSLTPLLQSAFLADVTPFLEPDNTGADTPLYVGSGLLGGGGSGSSGRSRKGRVLRNSRVLTGRSHKSIGSRSVGRSSQSKTCHTECFSRLQHGQMFVSLCQTLILFS